MQITDQRARGELRTISSVRQILGRRMGLEPYYTVAEHSATLLRLVSRPEANKVAGMRIVGVGAALIVVALVVAISGLLSAMAGAGFAAAGLALAIAGLLGGLGYQRAVGGYAVLTLSNSVICDATTATISFRQGSKVGTEREQQLTFSQVSGLRLRRRSLATGWPLRRIRAIIAIELLVGEQLWVVDTASDPEALRPAAEALAEVMGREFMRE